jgi:hypothetical protein
MRMLSKFKKYILAIPALIAIALASGCGGGSPATIRPPTEEPASTEAPISTGEPVSTPDFNKIDQVLKASLIGSIAYNAPQAMKLNEIVTIELLLNPSVEPTALATQITGGGPVITASIQVTPRMKAVLIPQGEDTFLIQPMHDNPEQLIGSTETTKWSWDVTAKKAGTHRLTLVIYRLITVDGNENWRLVESYKSDIAVEVSMIQRILMLDWKWISGILVTAFLIPAFWRWIDQRKKQTEAVQKSKQPKKKAR